MIVFCDTSVLVAACIHKHPHYERARKGVARAGLALRVVFAVRVDQAIFVADDDLFTVRVMLGKAGKEDAKSRVNDGVNEEPEIIRLLRDNPQLSRRKLAGILNLGIATIDRQLCTLKENGVIARIGSDKTGHWEIVNSKP